MNDLPRKIKQKSREAAMRARNVKRGQVISESPMKVEMFADGHVLTSDDFDLTQMVRVYDHQIGIEKGDTVLLMREGGEWTITDVISDNDVKGAFGSDG